MPQVTLGIILHLSLPNQLRLLIKQLNKGKLL